MSRQYLILIIFVVLTIAYFDVIDSCKEIDNIINEISELNSISKNRSNVFKQTLYKKQTNQNSNIKSSTGFVVFE